MKNRKLVLFSMFSLIIVFPNLTYADGPYLNIPPTNAFDKIHTNSGTVFAANFSMPLNIIGGPGVTVSANNSTHTVTITGTTSNGTTITALTCALNYQLHAVNASGFFFCAPNNMTTTGKQGTYNQTLANDVIINSGGFKINFINGTGNPVNVKNSNSGQQVNVTISNIASAAINSINSQVGPAYNINCQTGNTTCTNSTNRVTIGFGPNPVIINGSPQTVSKAITLNNLILGGNANGGNFNFTNLRNVNASKFFQSGNQVIDTLNSGSGISITGSGNSRTITNTGVLSAITSINSNTNPAQTIQGTSGNITVTDVGATHTINTGNDIAHISKFNNFTNSNSIQSGKNLYLDGGKNNYITQSSNKTSFFNQGTEHVRIGPTTIGTNTNQATFGDLTTNSSLITNTALAQFLSPSNPSVVIMTNDASGNQGQLKLRYIPSFTTMQLPGSLTQLGGIDFQGIRTTAPLFATATSIRSNTAEAWSGSANGAYLSFITTKIGGTSTSENFRILDSGNIAMNSAQRFNIDGVIGTGDTYITESSANVMDFFAGGTNILRLGISSITLANKIINTAIADPVAAAGQFWLSSTNADVLKYSSASTTYNLLSTKSVLNATKGQLSGNGTGTSSTSQVMDGVYATLTPTNTARITVMVTGNAADSVISDGCNIGIRESTSNMGGNGATIAGSLLGNNIKTNSGVANQVIPFSRIYDFSGTIGTQYFFDLGFSAVTGGTCTITNVNWDLVEH